MINNGVLVYNDSKQVKFPASVTSLTLGPKYNKLINSDTLPPTLTTLIFDPFYPRDIILTNLPKSLKTLILPHTQAPVLNKDCLPPGLTTLNLGDEFECELMPGFLPQTLTSLNLGSEFDHDLHPRSLPPSLMELKIGPNFEGVLEGMLPSTLTSLTFDPESVYDYEFLPGTLPAGLKTLVLGNDYNQPFIVGSLPPSLTSLSFVGDNYYEHPFAPGVLPTTLTSLKFSKFTQVVKSAPYPTSITKMRLECNDLFPSVVFPSSLTKLSLINDYFLSNEEEPVPFMPDSSLTRLNYNGYLGVGLIPDSVTDLMFAYGFTGAIEPGYLPESITKLTMSYTFDSQIFKGCLPSSIHTLLIRGLFNRDIETGALPSSLTWLEMGDMFEFDFLPGQLPDSLTYMKLGNQYTFGFTDGVLPPSLTTLILGGTPKDDIVFPRKLTNLSIPSILQLQHVKCPVDHLTLASVTLTAKVSTIRPVTVPIKTLTIHATGAAFKQRAQFLKAVVRAVPNADAYDINITKGDVIWTTQLRKLDQWCSIVVSDRHNIQFFKMDVYGEKMVNMEEMVHRLTNENDSLKTQLAESNAKLAKALAKIAELFGDASLESIPEPPVVAATKKSPLSKNKRRKK
ncbi:hypothetical protein SAMD00019534_085330 [Acytostelium subglobosum LB1]|uniref:hypothetical protein n=1 Tax=Acytostelium subglobosum LB1 TaxID=1410327 RepID=UPI000645065B|nr:hypothetical protein SAMD00019534_085330 [Acytostelium subglobosum LB1]GAM25358.1 hypothetical protein SAMD00019534_085330 [Acytostelium subglobosum LB1]|eukprot:XP_012751878.1 hypothetical protein SAMD00019534_085330 [Acytostelium subglobosum LB1]